MVQAKLIYYYFPLSIAVPVAAMLFCFTAGLGAQHDFLHKTPIDFFDLPYSIEGNEVQDILQDRAGYMWFASKAGLIRYDGRNFRQYRHLAADSTSISYDAVETLLETRDGALWVGTWGGGLNRLDPTRKYFTRYPAVGPGENGLSNNFVADLVEDAEGFLWIATRGGLNRFDPRTGAWRLFLPRSGDETSISSPEVRTLYLDRAQTLWVGTGYPWNPTDRIGGLNRYDAATESFQRYRARPGEKDALQSDAVTALFEDAAGNFWVGTRANHVHLLDRASGRFRYLEDFSTFRLRDTLAHIRSFYEDPEEPGIWALSYGSGLRRYRPDLGLVDSENFSSVGDKRYVYPVNHAWLQYRSRDGTRWLCTGDIGDKIFKSQEYLPFIDMQATTDYIQIVHEDATTGDLWFARRHNGLHRVNWENNVASATWLEDPQHPERGSFINTEDTAVDGLFDNLGDLVTDSTGTVWFVKSELGAGLFCFAWREGELQRYRHQPGVASSLSSDTLLRLAEDADGRYLWLLAADGTLNRFTKADGTVRRYQNATHPGFPLRPLDLLTGTDGQLSIVHLIDNETVALATYDPRTEGFTQRATVSLGAAPLTSPKVVDLRQFTDGSIWVGLERYLIEFTPAGAGSVYSIPENLGELRSMLPDGRQAIWLATTRGLAAFHREDHDFQPVSGEHDTRTQPFQPGAATNHLGTELFFCGRAGCLFVNELTQASYYHARGEEKRLDPEQIQITAFLLNGDEMVSGPFSIDSLMAKREIRLAYDQNNFSLELTLLDFQVPQNNRFTYQLSGYDQHWRTTGDRNTAYYAQVPPGNYVLRVQGRNALGELGEARPIVVIISPPWWQSWWAYTFYGLLALGLLYAGYRFLISRQLAKSEARRLQELNVTKSRLYTNITHEFRTPLTVILGMTDQLARTADSAQREQVEMIGRNGRNLLYLVNQLLDLARLEAGQLALQLQRADLVSYLKYLVESFHSYAENRQVKIHFLSDLEQQEMDFDAAKIQQVISNLLANAIKFTPAGGDIYLSAKTIREEREKLLIQVRDTGIGISPERLPHIFERFYQADDCPTREQAGTGIGLALVAELVKLMQGSITARSEVGKGTEISLRLPVARVADRAEELFFSSGHVPEDNYPPLQGVEPAPAISSGEDHPTILLVEDNYDVRQYLRACLTDNFKLLVAVNGQQGVEQAISVIPDIIISDVMMPVKDGYTLARELRADERTSHIPIILLTAKADLDSRLAGISQGVDAYLAKPFHPRELRLRLHKLLEQRARLRTHYLGLSPDGPPTEAPMEAEDEFVRKVKSAILERLDDAELDVPALSRTLGMSRSQLQRKLTALTGLSANRFLRHVRLEKARELLSDPANTVAEIAFATGYRDPSYFGRVFKKETGMTPVAWREERTPASPDHVPKT
ncbi:MAG: ATP-binding protein [Bacteroidota bacterium]